jgi:hypothetical protein
MSCFQIDYTNTLVVSEFTLSALACSPFDQAQGEHDKIILKALPCVRLYNPQALCQNTSDKGNGIAIAR